MSPLSDLARHAARLFALAALVGASLFPIAAHATLIATGADCPSATNLNGGLGTVIFSGGTASTTSQVFIGCVGTGTMTLNGGSSGNGITTFNANSASGAGITAGFFGTGTITVDGTGGAATLNSVRSIQIGGSSGTGTLNVLNGGVVQTTGSNFGVVVGQTGATGTVNVTGAGSTLSSAGRIDVGSFDNSNGSMTISGGGTVQTTGTSLANTEVLIGAGMNATGYVTVTGAGSALITGGLIVGDAVAGSTGSLLIQNGATASASMVAPGVGGIVSIGGGTSGTVTVTGAGSSLNVAPITSGFFAGKEVLIGGFANGTLLVDNSAAVTAAGANVIVSGGFFGTATSSPGLLTVKNGATLTANTVTINANGTLNGDGTIIGDVVLNGGTISPGNSPGTLTIDGDLALNDGTLIIEIESPSVFDILDVSGNIFVGEDLQLNLVFGFAPAGNVFDIEDFFTGFSSLAFDPGFSLFGNVNVSGLTAGSFVTIALGDAERTFRQASVPLPGTIPLILIGLAGLGFARRRNA